MISFFSFVSFKLLNFLEGDKNLLIVSMFCKVVSIDKLQHRVHANAIASAKCNAMQLPPQRTVSFKTKEDNRQSTVISRALLS